MKVEHILYKKSFQFGVIWWHHQEWNQTEKKKKKEMHN